MTLNNTNFKLQLITFFLVTCLFFVFRFLPHPPNFTPVIALTLYGSILFGNRSIPFIILAFAISDIFLGFHKLLLFTWGSLALIGLLHKFFNSFLSRIFGCLISAFVFYLLTNFGVWLLSNTYSGDIAGLITCYVMGLPFLKNSLASSLVIAIFIELLITMKFAKVYISKINTKFSY